MDKIIIPSKMYICPTKMLPNDDVTVTHIPEWDSNDEMSLCSLLVGTADGVLRHYKISTHDTEFLQTPTFDIQSHEDLLTSIGTLSEGDRIFTGSHDGLMKEWTKNGKIVHVFDGEKGAVLSILVYNDEIYTSTVTGDILAWHARNRNLLRVFQASPAAVTHMRKYGNANIVTGSCDGKVCLWQRKEGNPPNRILTGLTKAVSDLDVHPDGYVYSCTCPNPAALKVPERVLSAKEIKALAREPKTSSQNGSVSWDLHSGWQVHCFPNNITCLLIYKYEKDLKEKIILITGHVNGLINVWLTEGRSVESLLASKDSNYWNARLAAAEEELEEIRKIEEVEAEILAKAKSARKPYFGLSLLLTSGSDRGDRCGLNTLASSSKVELIREDPTPSLTTLFKNSLDARPDLLWSGLNALNRHCTSLEAEPAIRYKEAVDKKREEIAQIRELAVAADRAITDLLTKGQLLKTLKGLKSPVTSIAVSRGVVYGSAEGQVAGWELSTGRLRECLEGLEGRCSGIKVNKGWVYGVNSEGVFMWRPKILTYPASDLIKLAPKESAYIIPPPQLNVKVLSRSIDLPNVNVSDDSLLKVFLSLDPVTTVGKAGSTERVVPLSKFMSYWNSLDHCSVSDDRFIRDYLNSYSFQSSRGLPQHRTFGFVPEDKKGIRTNRNYHFSQKTSWSPSPDPVVFLHHRGSSKMDANTGSSLPTHSNVSRGPTISDPRNKTKWERDKLRLTRAFGRPEDEAESLLTFDDFSIIMLRFASR